MGDVGVDSRGGVGLVSGIGVGMRIKVGIHKFCYTL